MRRLISTIRGFPKKLYREIKVDIRKIRRDDKRFRKHMLQHKIPLGYRIEAGIIGMAVTILGEAGFLAMICTVLWMMKMPPFTPEEWANGWAIVLFP